MSTNDRPALISFRASKESTVWPMVVAGVSNSEIHYARDMTPDWDLEDWKMTEVHTPPVPMENKPGVPIRVVALFAHRDFNVKSLAVGETEYPEIPKVTIIVEVDEAPFEQVTKQLNKLVNILKIAELGPEEKAECRLTLLKVCVDETRHTSVLQVVDLF